MFEEKYKAEIDALYPCAVALLPQYKESGILITDLQRRFLTGHTICALVMERLEKNGFVSGYNGATPRKVYPRKIQMKYFEVCNQFFDYALISAENVDEAVQLYISEVHEIIKENSEFEGKIREVSPEYALMKYIRATCKDGKTKDADLNFISDERRVILIDGSLT